MSNAVWSQGGEKARSGEEWGEVLHMWRGRT